MSWASGENGYWCTRCKALGAIASCAVDEMTAEDPDGFPVNCVQHCCPDCDRPVFPAHVCETCFKEEPHRGHDRCLECLVAAGDYEPPEPDGECFRGGEAAAYQAEEMARVQRELK